MKLTKSVSLEFSSTIQQEQVSLERAMNLFFIQHARLIHDK